ncbi:MAG: hypothetical protein V3S00_04210, partial [Dehalococcoidia bacterium]
ILIDTVTVSITGRGITESSDTAVVNVVTPIGGTVELQVSSGGAPESASVTDGSTSDRDYGLLMAGLAATVIAAAAGAWYARKRYLQ